jgi:hypothetical protein
MGRLRNRAKQTSGAKAQADTQKQMLTKKDLERFWDLAKNLPVTARNNHSYLSIMEHQSRSSLIKLLFAEDESVVSSTISEDAAEENQTQSQDELTNPNPSNTMDTSENDKVSILGSESVSKKPSKTRKRDINSVYEDQHINGDEMPIDCPNPNAAHHVYGKLQILSSYLLSTHRNQSLKLKWMIQMSMGTLSRELKNQKSR